MVDVARGRTVCGHGEKRGGAHCCDGGRTSSEALREGLPDVPPTRDERGTGRSLQLVWQILTNGQNGNGGGTPVYRCPQEIRSSPGNSTFEGHWSQMTGLVKGLGKVGGPEEGLPHPRSQ